MKQQWKRWLVAGALGLMVQGAALPSFAEDEMTFGEEEVKEVDRNSQSAALIDEGKKLYNSQKYEEASLLFHKVLLDEDVAAEPFHPEAQYELGKTLFRLELYQGALRMFGQVVDGGEAHPYYLPTLRGLVLLMDVAPGDPDLLERLKAYVGKFPKEVPAKYRDKYAFLVGRQLYNDGDYPQALKLLGEIEQKSELYVRARYIMGATYVASYDAKKALGEFKRVLRVLMAQRDEGKLTDEDRDLLEKSFLAMARVFYSAGEYNKAIKYYSRIPRSSKLWPLALFESSWAYFQLDLFNKALGNLHTLNSPFFSDAYFPEAPILSAVLFFYNCRYPRVRYALEEFDFSYAPLKDELEGVLKKYEDSSAMYAWMQKLRGGEAEEDEKLTRILAASLGDQELLRKIKLVEAIEKESKKLDTLSGTWKGSPLGTQVLQDTAVAQEFAVTGAGDLAKQRLERVKRELEDYIVNRERILFEISRAEKGEIDADMKAGMVVERNVKDVAKIDVTDEQLYWTFDGEYWRDELGFYLFDVKTECKR
jgi:hypothetical protein